MKLPRQTAHQSLRKSEHIYAGTEEFQPWQGGGLAMQAGGGIRNFAGIVAALGIVAGTPVVIGDDPPLTVNYNAGGGGFGASLIFELNPGVHITIFQNSWDGTVTITDLDGSLVSIGPYVLHLTTTNDRWFRQYVRGSWQFVTDYGTPSARVLRAFDSMLATMEEYLFA